MLSKIIFAVLAISVSAKNSVSLRATDFCAQGNCQGSGDLPGPRGLFSNFLQRAYN